MALLLLLLILTGLLWIGILQQFTFQKISIMADQTAQILQLVQDSATALGDLVTSEQEQDTQLDALIKTAEDIKNAEASGADQTQTVTKLTEFVAALKTAATGSKTQTAKVQAALTALQTTPPPPPPVLTDKTYTDSAGETIVIAQAGALPSAGETVTVNGAAAALATYTLSDGAILNVSADSKVVSYTPHA